MPEQPVPTPALPDETPPAPIEAAQHLPPPPKETVPQFEPPPEPEQIALLPPPPPAAQELTPSHPAAARVALNKPRAVKAAARVATPPNPVAQGEGEMQPPSPGQASSVMVSADAFAAWQASLVAWLDAHRAYPEAARRLGEQGAVGVRFTLSENGEVSSADIQRGSGSTMLDAATLAMLRGAHLPPPPPGTDAARRTISVSIRYQLN